MARPSLGLDFHMRQPEGQDVPCVVSLSGALPYLFESCTKVLNRSDFWASSGFCQWGRVPPFFCLGSMQLTGVRCVDSLHCLAHPPDELFSGGKRTSPSAESSNPYTYIYIYICSIQKGTAKERPFILQDHGESREGSKLCPFHGGNKIRMPDQRLVVCLR